MAQTSKGLRYPIATDNPNIPQDIQNLASDIDTLLNSYATDAENTTYSLSVATDGSGVKVTLADSDAGNTDDFFNIVPSGDLTVSFSTVSGVDTVTIGVNGELSALAGLTSAADRLPYFTGSGTASLATFTSFGRSLVDDADATAARTTLGLGTMATETASNYLTTTNASSTYAALAGAIFTGDITLGTSRVLIFEGSSDDANETILTVTNPTEDRTITLPNASGTVALTSDLGSYATTSSLSAYVDKAIVDAKGDLIVGTASDTVSRLAVGVTNGHVLTIDSTTATGLKWAAPSGGSVSTLSDVLITNLQQNQILKYNGSNWVNATDLSGGTGATYDLNAGGAESPTINLVGSDDTTDTITFSPGGAITLSRTLNTITISSTDTDTNWYPTTYTWTDGTTAGPTGSLTGTGMSGVSFAAVPSASATTSGIVTTGTQTFAGNKTFSNDVTITGDLTVNGTTTNINTTNLVVEDKNIVLGDVTTPSNTTADGGGITLKGASDKTLNWVNATGAWTSSEDFNLITGKVYEINGVSVLSATTLGVNVVNSSLTKVGLATAGFVKVDASGNLSSDTTTYAPSALSGAGTSVTLTSNNYTLLTGDRDKLIEVSNTVATNVTVDSTLNSLPAGSQIHLLQTNSGQITVLASGVTVNGTPTLKLRAQWSGATLIKRSAPGSGVWVLIGDLASS